MEYLEGSRWECIFWRCREGRGRRSGPKSQRRRPRVIIFGSEHSAFGIYNEYEERCIRDRLGTPTLGEHAHERKETALPVLLCRK